MRPGVALILLAAGGATRMGRPKQLLPYQGRTLLRHAAEVGVTSGLNPILVVLGAFADLLEPELAGLPISAVRNPDWERGMGTSIRAGMQVLPAGVDLSAVVLALCDQPLLSPAHLQALVSAYQDSGKPVVASEYAGTLGVPALFDRGQFGRLEQLADSEGAKRLILQAGDDAYPVPFPGGAVDIDTPEDYERLGKE